MEKENKRWRPTLTAYRALENDLSKAMEQNKRLSQEVCRLKGELGDASETVSMLVRENGAWREKFLALKGRGFWERVFNK